MRGSGSAMGASEHDGIGGRVRAARQRTGLSREALAFYSGVSWSAITQIEGGRRVNLRPNTLASLARALSVSIDYLVLGRPASDPMFEHQALLYDSEEELVTTAASFLAGAVERGEAVLAVMRESHIASLRDALGPRADHVQSAERSAWYSTPTAALRAYRAFLDRAVESGASWVRIIGEPDWGDCSESQVRSWTRYESLINLAFRGMPVSVLCLYNTSELGRAVTEQARTTHPHMLNGESLTPSTHYAEPAGFALEP